MRRLHQYASRSRSQDLPKKPPALGAPESLFDQASRERLEREARALVSPTSGDLLIADIPPVGRLSPDKELQERLGDTGEGVAAAADFVLVDDPETSPEPETSPKPPTEAREQRYPDTDTD